MQTDLIEIIIVAAGYLVTLLVSGWVVRYFIGGAGVNNQPDNNQRENQYRFEVGTIIGKCENIITLTFIITEQYTGLALIFAAKSLVRKDEIEKSEKNARYYLGGTLVNFTFSMVMGFVIRAFLAYFQ